MTTRRGLSLSVLCAALMVLGSACGGSDPAPADEPTATASPVMDPGDGGQYAPTLDPANFVDVVDNPFYPLPPGARWVYEGTSDGEAERAEVVVTGDRRMILGISATVVRDTVSVAGEVVEDTYDWFAQDRDGNVWYLGEASSDIENGQVVSTEGSWEAGVNGAYPGIVMKAAPNVGDVYRQEYYPGEAEDMAEVLEVGPDQLLTREWNPLDPEPIEEKTYKRGVGPAGEELVRGGEGSMTLMSFTPS